MRMSRAGSGFTLIEVMVAIAVLTVGILGAMAAIAGARKSAFYSEENETMTRLIQKKIENLRGIGAMDKVVDEAYKTWDESSTEKWGKYITKSEITVLSELEASNRFSADLNRDGTIDGLDLYDLDNDSPPNPGETITDDGIEGGAANIAQRSYGIVPLKFELEWKSLAGGTGKQVVYVMMYPR